MTGAKILRVEREPAPLPSNVQNEFELARWRDERNEADAALRTATTERARMLTTASVDAIARKDATIATARLRAERAEAVVGAAERRFAEQAAAEAAKEPERRRRYAAGKKASAEAERILRAEYGPAAAALADILRRLSALQPAIDAANRDLPKGQEPLDPDGFRGRPAIAGRHEERTRVVTIDQDGQQVRNHVLATGPSRAAAPWARASHGGTPTLRQEERTETVWVEGTPGIAVKPLTATVVLPGLSWDDNAFWPLQA